MYNKTQTAPLRRAALENLDFYQLPDSPDNYRLWFEYAAGRVETLNAALDELIGAQSPVTDSACQQLYVEHLAGHDQCELDQTRLAIGELLGILIEHMDAWADNSSEFHQTLQRCAAILDRDPDIGQVRQTVVTLIEQINRSRAANDTLTSKVADLSSEISALRRDVDRLGNEAITDPLTLTHNRRSFYNGLYEAIETARKNYTPCALVVADIDNFKPINDEFGHTVGDKVLKYVAATLKNTIRGGDLLARYGGEEFAIVLPDTRRTGAEHVAENLRQAVSARQLTAGASNRIIGRITLSLGVSTYRPGDNPEQMFERADQRMYSAKRGGKNRVVSSDR